MTDLWVILGDNYKYTIYHDCHDCVKNNKNKNVLRYRYPDKIIL